MDHADDDGDNDDVFIYMGGNQRVPLDVTHVRVHKSVKIITGWAFRDCIQLVSIEMHDGVEIIGIMAFHRCISLRGIKLPGVRIIESWGAFSSCTALVEVEFGDKLESIGDNAFASCTSLRTIKIPKVREIGHGAFVGCVELTEADLSADLHTIVERAFSSCPRLRRITMPLKDNLLGEAVFNHCDALSQVDLVGGIHKTVSSLLLKSWRNDMNNEIDRINRDLPNTPTSEKTVVIQQWIIRVIRRIEYYKSEHYALLKNNMSHLELALWGANLPNVDTTASRDEARVTCGANIIIPHVLSFLNDNDAFPLVDYHH